MIIDNILSTNTIREKVALCFPSHGINEPIWTMPMRTSREMRKFDRSVIWREVGRARISRSTGTIKPNFLPPIFCPQKILAIKPLYLDNASKQCTAGAL